MSVVYLDRAPATVRRTHGMICPRCVADHSLRVKATCDALLMPQGIERGSDLDFTPESFAECIAPKCGWWGTAGDCVVAARGGKSER